MQKKVYQCEIKKPDPRAEKQTRDLTPTMNQIWQTSSTAAAAPRKIFRV